jgi:hypothetical protein
MGRGADQRLHNRFRGLLMRWERIGAHYFGLLHLACALTAFRQTL